MSQQGFGDGGQGGGGGAPPQHWGQPGQAQPGQAQPGQAQHQPGQGQPGQAQPQPGQGAAPAGQWAQPQPQAQPGAQPQGGQWAQPQPQAQPGAQPQGGQWAQPQSPAQPGAQPQGGQWAQPQPQAQPGAQPQGGQWGQPQPQPSQNRQMAGAAATSAFGASGAAGMFLVSYLKGEPVEKPRIKGAMGAGLGLLVMVLNCVVLFATDRYYPVLVVVGLPFMLGGGALAAVGQPTGADGQPAGWGKIVVGAATAFGLICGVGLAILLGI